MDPEIEVAVGLAEELELFERRLEREIGNSFPQNEPGRAREGEKRSLIVWREVPGLRREIWNGLRDKGYCAGWHVGDVDGCAAPRSGDSPARTDVRREEHTGLWRPLPFLERVREELERNAQNGRSAALALFSVASSFEEADCSLCAGLWAGARPGDVPGRVDEGTEGGCSCGTVALFLPGRSVFQALALAEKVAREVDEYLARAGLGVRARAGVAASTDSREDCSSLLRRARQALESASRRDDAELVERVRLYRGDVSGKGHDVHETLVQASEKRFLFFGGAI